MNAPPVQYTRTSDGYNIAYMVSGEGPPIVFMPQVIQHSQLLWTGGYRRTFEHWLKRFRLVQYDSRGQGLSQRNLNGVAADDYVSDLGAVLGAVGEQRVVLHASSYFGHTAIRFAAGHPEQVAALVLHNCNLDSGSTPVSEELTEIALKNWEMYLRLVARAGFPGANEERLMDYFRASVSKADHEQLLKVGASSDIRDVAGAVQAPTLLIARSLSFFGNQHNTALTGPQSDYGRGLAPLIKGSRLVVSDDVYGREGAATPMALLVESFLDDVGFGQYPGPVNGHGLSEREVEVLRLIAAGRSNPQIADELVISINTVQRHVSNILSKTGLANRAEAAAYAARLGIG